jgi:hypothetical protein
MGGTHGRRDDAVTSKTDNPNAPPERVIEDMFAYAIIPLGDFTILPVTDSGQVKKIDNITLHFVNQFSNLPGIDSVFCNLDIKVPENWDTINPRNARTDYIRTMQGQLEDENDEQMEMVPKPTNPFFKFGDEVDTSALDDIFHKLTMQQKHLAKNITQNTNNNNVAEAAEEDL